MTTILVATDDGRDPTVPVARDAALRWAGEHGARVVLHDRAAESYFTDPYPSGTWTADVEGGPTREQLLGPDDLEMLGRRYLAEQVAAARRSGVDAHGWLPPRPGVAGMAEAIERFAVTMVVLPASMAQPSLLDRVRGNTAERFRDALGAVVIVADGAAEIPSGRATAGR
jgi:hypothetical protein